MTRHMHWQHGHRPMLMHRNPFGMFWGIAFGFMMLSFLFKTGLIFFVMLFGGLMLIKGAASMGRMACRTSSHDDYDEDIESYIKRKNDNLYGDDKRKNNDDDIVYF